MKPLSEQDRERIAEAVARAERGTSGEIRCVIARETADRRYFALTAAAMTALTIVPMASLAGLEILRLGGDQDWSSGVSPIMAGELGLSAYATVQAVILLVVWLLLSWPAVWRAMTPHRRIEARVKQAAIAQFEALGLTATRDRTGILLFVSLADHQAQVLADSGVYEKVDHAVWDEVVGLLVAGLKANDPAAGFVRAVDRTGEILHACLPPREDDENELLDGVVETRLSAVSDPLVDFLSLDHAPAHASGLLLAVWHGLRGEWQAAHDLAEADHSPDGAWVHGWLHRIEGDLGNAAYWYRRAGRPSPKDGVREEGERIARSLLGA